MRALGIYKKILVVNVAVYPGSLTVMPNDTGFSPPDILQLVMGDIKMLRKQADGYNAGILEQLSGT